MEQFSSVTPRSSSVKHKVFLFLVVNEKTCPYSLAVFSLVVFNHFFWQFSVWQCLYSLVQKKHKVVLTVFSLYRKNTWSIVWLFLMTTLVQLRNLHFHSCYYSCHFHSCYYSYHLLSYAYNAWTAVLKLQFLPEQHVCWNGSVETMTK